MKNTYLTYSTGLEIVINKITRTLSIYSSIIIIIKFNKRKFNITRYYLVVFVIIMLIVHINWSLPINHRMENYFFIPTRYEVALIKHHHTPNVYSTPEVM